MKKSLFKKIAGAALFAAAFTFMVSCSSSSGSDDSGDEGQEVIDPSNPSGQTVEGGETPQGGEGGGSNEGIVGTTGGSIKSNAGVSIIKAQGWLESGYVTWSDTAESYNVYYKSSSATDWTQVDSPLIRNYGDYARVDVLGLSSGDYDVKIHAVNDGTESEVYSEASISVASHDRAGYAFTGSTTPGAYKADGTLKAGTKVIYVTNSNFNTVPLTVNTKADGSKTTTLTGVQGILDTSGYFKYLEANGNAPLCIRIIGKIDTTGFPSGSWGSSEEGLQVKGSKDYSKTELTIEGVGDDATIHGFGILCRNTGYVELRNFAVMACADDCISLDTANEYTWVHNLDLFYGSTGGDSDQAKGDGTIDLKGDTRYQTYSYNHFWDSGKSSLCGMKSETGPNYITYHHNWFDHSDSRHPRIRTMTVHIYNNYYDGNSKYGVGATTGADAFVEANYFRNCKFPMMSSLQGNDVYAGSSTYDPTEYGTFSKESGGSIKSYNNKIVDTLNVTSYWPHANSLQTPLITKGTVGSLPSGVDTSVHFDAWEASTRDEQVPSTVTSYSGSDAYSNFDTASGFYSYSVQEPDAAKENIEKYAGRVEGGNFKWTFDNATEDTNYGVITALKSAIVNYVSDLVKSYGTKWVYGSSSSSSSGEEGGDTPVESNVAVTGVTLSKTLLTLKAGSSETITATIEPANATTQDVTWSSDKTSVAKVSNGKITAVAAGEAKITVTTKDGNFTATCTVTVEMISATDLTLSKTELELTVGKSETITATLTPSDATDSVTWTSGDKNIATVDKNGKITAVAAGTVTITAKAGTIEKTCSVTVNAAPADDLSGLVALSAGTYNLTTKTITVNQTDVAAVFSSQNAGDSQTKSGILITAKIDSAGANLNTKAVGTIYFKIDSDKTIMFTDSNSKGAALYAVNEDGSVSETAVTNEESTAHSYKYTLAAGTYAIKGTTTSSAKIASITVE